MFSLCVTVWSHISLQNGLLSTASGLTLSLCVPSNPLNNLFWFDSNNQFCLFYLVLLSYLSRFAPTTTNLCRTSSSNTSAPFLFTLNFLSSFDMTLSFYTSPRLILFNFPNSLRNTFCFSKILLRQLGCLSPIISLVLYLPSQQQYFQQHVILSFFSVIVSVFMRYTISLIFTVAALTFFLSMYLRLGGIHSGSNLIFFTTLINSSFSFSLYYYYHYYYYYYHYYYYYYYYYSRKIGFQYKLFLLL